MIRLDYKLDDEVRTAQDRARIPTYSYAHLETGFVGTQTFLVDGINLGSESISIFDFAATLLQAIRRFDAGETDATFYDIDSPGRIYFKRTGDKVQISDSIGRGPATVGLDEFKNAVLPYLTRLREELCRKFPELRQNETFLQALDEHRQAA